MGKNKIIWTLILCFVGLFWPIAHGQPVLKTPPAAAIVKVPEAQVRADLVNANQKYLAVRENRIKNAKGQWVYTNRGTELDKIQKRAGCPLGCFWCGAYMYVLHDDVGIDARKDLKVKNPLQVASWFSRADVIVWRPGSGNNRVGVAPQPGDVMRMFASHIEMYVGQDWHRDVARRRIPSAGGNTGGATGWQGVHITERNLAHIQLVSNYLTPYLASR